MLTLQTPPTFTVGVDIPLDGDKVARIQVEFRWMHHQQIREYLRHVELSTLMGNPGFRFMQRVFRRLVAWRIARKWASARIARYATAYDYLSEIVVSWSGVDMPFGAEACERLVLMHPQAPTLILGAWAKAIRDGRRGN